MKISEEEVAAKSDYGAQSSIITQKLVNRLKLQTVQTEGSSQIEGIDKSSTAISVSKCMKVQVSLYNQPVEVMCFMSDYANLNDHILLGSNCIFENLNVVLRWVSEIKPQSRTQEILDKWRSINPSFRQDR